MEKSELEKKLKSIGRRIAELREKRGFTQEELAEKVTISKRWMSRIENGWDTPSTTLIKIADALGIDLMEFLKKPTTFPRGRGRPKQKRKPKTGG